MGSTCFYAKMYCAKGNRCAECSRDFKLLAKAITVVVGLLGIIILCAVGLSGCGHSQSPLRAQYEITRRIFEDKTKAQIDPALYDRIILTWSPEKLPSRDPTNDHPKVGYASYDAVGDIYRVDLYYRECLCDTAWTYELIHVFAYDSWENMNPLHDEPTLWRGRESVLHTARRQCFVDGLCR